MLGSREPKSREELEVELARAVEALEHARVRSEGFANLSHEIRTLLNGVVGITGLLLDTQLSSEQRDYAKRIRASGDALLGLLNNVLDFSKVEANMLSIELVDFDLRRTCDEVGELLAERAQSKGLELVVWVDPATPAAVRGDPTRLRQTVLNLVSNAIKFTDSGEVVLRVAAETFTATSALVRFEVRDTGIGISEEGQRRLFQPFSQIDEEPGRGVGGTGLGLALAKRLVEAMGGEIGVRSGTGQGSTFWFTARFERSRRATGGSIPRVDIAGCRALVIDDSESCRLAVASMVEELDVGCDRVADGEAALGVLAAAVEAGHPIDVVVIDVHLEKPTAGEFLAKMRADAKFGSPQVIGLTNAGPRDPSLDAAVLLSKPVRRPQLHAALRTLMGLAVERTAPRERATGEHPPANRRESMVGVLRALGGGAPVGRTVSRPALNIAAGPGAIVEPDPNDHRPRILLVEDNAVNQRIAVVMVEKRGYRVDVAPNGFEAIEASQRVAYVAVLMDCQMPKLDGYATTGHIRRREGEAKHTPIIAMTANAGPGDREKCLAAGMDDYVSKPIVAEELDRVLRRWAPLPKATTGRRRNSSARPPRRESRRPPAARSDDASAPRPARERVEAPAGARVERAPIDFEVLERLRAVQRGDDGDLVGEVIDLFLSELPARVEAFKEALGKGDPAMLGRAAHTLKGSAGHLGAGHLAALCASVEEGSRQGAMSKELVDALVAEADRVKLALEGRKKGAP